MLARSVLFLALAVLSLPAAAAEGAADLVARFSKLSLGDAVTVSNLRVSSGRLDLTLASGTAAPVKAGDEVVGLFFKGDGVFAYRADEPLELPIVKSNLRYTKSSAALTDGVIRGNATELLVIGKVPALSGAPAASLSEAFAANRAIADLSLGSRLDFQAAQHRLLAPSTQFTRAEFRGADEWVYVYDDARTRTESLTRLYTWNEDHPRRQYRYEAPISNIPLGRGRTDAAHLTATLTALDYDVAASDGKDVKMTIRETVVPATNGATGLAFRLFNGIRYKLDDERHLRVKSVSMADGTKLPHAHVVEDLLVSLPAPTKAGVPVQLTFELEGDILYRPGGDNYWRLIGPWYPTPDASAAKVHGILRVKGPFVPFAGGKTIARRSEGGTTILESEIDRPVSYVTLTAGNFHFEELTRKGLTVRTASYGQKNVRAIKKLNELAFDMIGYFEFFLGPFPFTELNIVELNDYGWGQAPPGLVFITQEAFQPLLGTANQLFSEGVNERIAHEIAHQYWGHNVRWSSPEEQWLSESFAEYSAALLLKKFQGDAVYKRLLAHWKGNAKVANETSSIPLANRITTPNNEDWQRVHLLYSKGPLLLAALHKEVGDEAFLTFLKSYQKTFAGKPGTTKDVAGLLGFITKKDLKPFFDTYFWGTAMPPLHSSLTRAPPRSCR